MNRRSFVGFGLGAAISAAGNREESLARSLARELPCDGCEYLLLSISTGAVLAERWSDPAEPVALGSLVKPFVAIAYAESHGRAFPAFRCRAGECWLGAGHGEMEIRSALAHSCNSYFRQLAAVLDPGSTETMTQRYSLRMPPATSPEVLIGRYGSWKASPREITLAYAELGARRAEPCVQLVMDGMRLCAASGTASAARARAAAKTGTAPCEHRRASNGDGLIAAVFPEQMPDFVLLVRGHGAPGAQVAGWTAPFFRAVNFAR